MRWKGIHHIELSVLDYEASIAFFDKMFGWLGYKSFWSLDLGYRSTYYMARFPFFHSYIGIQPARDGGAIESRYQSGVHHVALWAKGRKEVKRFYSDFLLKNSIEVTDPPAEYPTYTPGYFAVFFNDPITGIHFELSRTPLIPSLRSYMKWRNILKEEWEKHSNWKKAPWQEAMRELPRQKEET